MSALPLPADSPAEPLRFTVADYYRLAEVGILAPDARVELLDGEILRMSPMGSRHAGTVGRLNFLLGQALGDRAFVNSQVPLRLNDFSEPEPDLLVLPMREDFFTRSHPGPEDVYLVVEVSDTSLTFDRQVKLPLYAASGVAEVWIVDLPEGLLRVHRRPAGREYAEIRSLAPGESVSPLAFPDVSFPVERLIGHDASR